MPGVLLGVQEIYTLLHMGWWSLYVVGLLFSRGIYSGLFFGYLGVILRYKGYR